MLCVLLRFNFGGTLSRGTTCEEGREVVGVLLAVGVLDTDCLAAVDLTAGAMLALLDTVDVAAGLPFVVGFVVTVEEPMVDVRFDTVLLVATGTTRSFLTKTP